MNPAVRQGRARRREWLVLVLAPLFLAACAGPAYYWQAASGHLRLIQARQDIEAIRTDPDSDPELIARLDLAEEILRFADQRLALPADGNFRSLVEVGGPVTWNVTVTPEFSLTARRWCFPVAGCVQYRGYFREADAHNFAARMRRRGFDVAVLPALAYSTLGWFEDPLLDTVLHQPPGMLAGTLVHELAHQRIYVPGDTEFNEAYATFVERAGVRAWLTATGREQPLRVWTQWLQAGRQLNELLVRLRRDLMALYASESDETARRAAKARIFREFRSGYEELRVHEWHGRDYFHSWLAQDLNNAHVIMLAAYAGERCAFAEALREANGDFAAFHRRIETIARLDQGTRQAWLNADCPAVASAEQL